MKVTRRDFLRGALATVATLLFGKQAVGASELSVAERADLKAYADALGYANEGFVPVMKTLGEIVELESQQRVHLSMECRGKKDLMVREPDSGWIDAGQVEYDNGLSFSIIYGKNV